MATLFYGGSIVTMEAGQAPEAVLVDEGRICALGSAGDLERRAGRRVNLSGGALLPAFVDAHSHFSQVAASFLQVSLAGATTREELQRRIADFVAQHRLAPGEWVIARDYDQNLLPGQAHLTREDLESIAPEHPLVLQHQSGHMGLFNARALAALGVTPQTPDPEGGRIGRENGALTGYGEEAAYFDWIKRVPQPEMAQLLEGYESAQTLYAAHGITVVQEGMVVAEMLPLYDALAAQGRLKLDVVLYPQPEALEETQRIAAGKSHLMVGGMKIFLDGSPQGRTAWMRKPYAGESEYRGYGVLTDEQVLDAFRLAGKQNLQLLAHCNGDGAVAQFLRCLRQAESEYPGLRRQRCVIVHGQLMGLDQLEQAAKLGAMASFFVAHVWHWGDAHLRNFGAERALRISPAASALRCGLPFTFHQDAPVIVPDMLETVWCAVNRRTKSGGVLGMEERISPLEALRAVTRTAAWQYGMEQERGSIAPGKRADFVLLEQDPLAVPPERLGDIRVMQTWKDGKCVFRR